MKKADIILLCVSILGGLLIAEAAARWLILPQKIAKAQAELVAYDRYFNDPEVLEIRNKYEDRLDHLRPGRILEDDQLPATALIFREVRKFGPENRANILLQGDSWAEAALEHLNLLTGWAEKQKVGLVLAGTSSYAPSAMRAQLAILRSDFDLHPDVIVAIIDQTDIGDEIYRYSAREVSSDGRIVSLGDAKTNALKRSNWSIRRQDLMAGGSALLRLVQGLWYESRDGALDVSGSAILAVLEDGPTDEQQQLFTTRLEEYLRDALSDPGMEHMILVTHPHLRQISDQFGAAYSGNVAPLVDLVAKNIVPSGKVTHLNLHKNALAYAGKFGAEKIFAEGDRFSHLTEKAYGESYYPAILEQLNLGLAQ